MVGVVLYIQGILNLQVVEGVLAACLYEEYSADVSFVCRVCGSVSWIVVDLGDHFDSAKEVPGF